jgi:uncharacterized protein (DUF488 family)
MGVIYTIGYEGTDVERFIETLGAVGVDLVADVRAVALSRKRGFSKKTLSARLQQASIEYLHFSDLGDPKPGREAARARRYNEFRVIYESHMGTKAAQASLRDLISVARERPTCLLCFERDPVVCHRSIVAQEMVGSGFEIFDLYGDDPDRYVRNISRMPRYYPCEGAPPA